MEMKGFVLEKVTYIASYYFQVGRYNLLGKFDKKCLFLYFPWKRTLVTKTKSLNNGRTIPSSYHENIFSSGRHQFLDIDERFL
jgi:hypothetical protein